MAFSHIRKFVYQNPTSGKIYEVSLQLNTDGTIDGKGLLLGTNKVNSDPALDNTKVTFVVLTAQSAKVFGTEDGTNWKTNDHLKLASIYDASNRTAAGAALSTLLV